MMSYIIYYQISIMAEATLARQEITSDGIERLIKQKMPSVTLSASHIEYRRDYMRCLLKDNRFQIKAAIPIQHPFDLPQSTLITISKYEIASKDRKPHILSGPVDMQVNQQNLKKILLIISEFTCRQLDKLIEQKQRQLEREKNENERRKIIQYQQQKRIKDMIFKAIKLSQLTLGSNQDIVVRPIKFHRKLFINTNGKSVSCNLYQLKDPEGAVIQAVSFKKSDVMIIGYDYLITNFKVKQNYQNSLIFSQSAYVLLLDTAQIINVSHLVSMKVANGQEVEDKGHNGDEKILTISQLRQIKDKVLLQSVGGLLMGYQSVYATDPKPINMLILSLFDSSDSSQISAKLMICEGDYEGICQVSDWVGKGIILNRFYLERDSSNQAFLINSIKWDIKLADHTIFPPIKTLTTLQQYLEVKKPYQQAINIQKAIASQDNSNQINYRFSPILHSQNTLVQNDFASHLWDKDQSYCFVCIDHLITDQQKIQFTIKVSGQFIAFGLVQAYLIDNFNYRSNFLNEFEPNGTSSEKGYYLMDLSGKIHCNYMCEYEQFGFEYSTQNAMTCIFQRQSLTFVCIEEKKIHKMKVFSRPEGLYPIIIMRKGQVRLVSAKIY